MLLLLVAVAGVANAGGVVHIGSLRLRARPGGRVEIVLPPRLRHKALRVAVDGRQLRVTSWPMTFSVRGLSSARQQALHRLAVRDRTASATVEFVVGSRSGTDPPTLLLTSVPKRANAPSRTTFRYTSSGGTISCSLDGAPYGCSAEIARVTASTGRHVFRVHARSRRGSAAVAWAWTVAHAQSTQGSTTSPSTPTSPGAPAPGTGTPPAGNQLLMSDDFSGTTIDTTKWLVYGPDWPGNGGNGIRDGSAVSVRGGVLTITAQMVNGTLVSGAIASRINFTYGWIQFRVRTDADPSQATSGVGLLWPQSNDWPIDGEIDIYETGTNPTRSPFSSFVHYGPSNQQIWIGQNADGTQWHTMAVEWSPDAITFYRDGAVVGTVTNPAAIPHVAHHLCLQLDAFSSKMTGIVKMQVADVGIYALTG